MIRVYLDTCCFNRPYDIQSHLIVELETIAKLKVQELIADGEFEMVSSYILEMENDANPYLERKIAIESFLRYAAIDIDENQEVIDIANTAKLSGLKTKDALHLACAVIARCNYFLTTDRRLLKYQDSRIKLLNPIQFLLEMEAYGYE